MTLIPLTSRTFVRNFRPFNYPEGTRRGHAWTSGGGLWDNTDPRNPVYWGPPRIVNGDPDFALKPGETPENGVRRLKIEGYIGLYSLRAAEERRVEKPKPLPAGEGTLERIRRAKDETTRRRERAGEASREARANGVKPSRADERRDERRAGPPEPVSAPELIDRLLDEERGPSVEPPGPPALRENPPADNWNDGAGDEDDEARRAAAALEAEDARADDEAEAAESDEDEDAPVGGTGEPSAEEPPSNPAAGRRLAGGGARRPAAAAA